MKTKESTFLVFCILFLCVSMSAGHRESFIRLAGGQDPSEGRVEIFHDGAWGTVCDDGWDMNDAQVVCRQLNFPAAIEASVAGKYGQGSGNIWMDDVSCTGAETNLGQCGFRGWGNHDCKHGEDAGVRCEKASELPIIPVSRDYDVDHLSSLSDQLGELFDSGRGCDLNISVVVNNNTIEEICAHEVILSLNSDLKTSQPDLSSLAVDVTSNCSQHANSFVRYFYTGRTKLTASNAPCILKMAFDWELTGFQKEAADIIKVFLPDDPTFQSQSSFYEYAVYAGDEALQDVCLCYLAWNCEALIGSPAWTKLSFGLVEALLSRSDLVVQNETVILDGLERWAEARGNATIPETLLKLIHFPMMPAEDLYKLDGSHYRASKLQGFQFNALPFKTLLGDVRRKQNSYTSRIYMGQPWSFTVSHQTAKIYKDYGFYSFRGQTINSLTSDYQTPVHNTAYLAFYKMLWKTRVYMKKEDCSGEGVTCPSLPAVSLKVGEKNSNLPPEMEEHIRYSNTLVVTCDERFVFHVEEFKGTDGKNLAFVPNSTEQAYQCHSNRFSFQVVVRPHYSTD